MATFRRPDGTLVEGRERCEVDGAKILPCFPMEGMLDREAKRARPRLKLSAIVKMRAPEQRAALVVFLSGEFWTEVTFCFVCGVRLDGAAWVTTKREGGT